MCKYINIHIQDDRYDLNAVENVGTKRGKVDDPYDEEMEYGAGHEILKSPLYGDFIQ
jgi:hypothetical protein